MTIKSFTAILTLLACAMLGGVANAQAPAVSSAPAVAPITAPVPMAATNDMGKKPHPAHAKKSVHSKSIMKTAGKKHGKGKHKKAAKKAA